MKKSTRKTLRLYAVSAGLLIIASGLLYKIYLSSYENKIKEKINNYSFEDNSYLKGLKINTKDVKCNVINPMHSFDCKLYDVEVYFNKDDKKLDFLSVHSVDLKSKNSSDSAFEISAKQITLYEGNKLNIFAKSPNKEIQELGKKVHDKLFPFDLDININRKILKKDEQTIDIDFSFENETLRSEFKTDGVIKLQPHQESIKIKVKDAKEIGDQIFAEAKMNSPFYMALNNIEYQVYNKNIAALIYDFYKLRTVHIKEYPEQIKKFNDFYLHDDKNRLLTLKEFQEGLSKSVKHFSRSIPNEQKQVKEHLINISKLLKKQDRVLYSEIKNTDGSSIIQFDLLGEIDNFQEVTRILNSTYEIKSKIK